MNVCPEKNHNKKKSAKGIEEEEIMGDGEIETVKKRFLKLWSFRRNNATGLLLSFAYCFLSYENVDTIS